MKVLILVILMLRFFPPQSSNEEKDSRIRELEMTLKESVKLTAEREMLLANKEDINRQLEQQVGLSLVLPAHAVSRNRVPFKTEMCFVLLCLRPLISVWV